MHLGIDLAVAQGLEPLISNEPLQVTLRDLASTTVTAAGR